jgi:hypothetical protein
VRTVGGGVAHLCRSALLVPEPAKSRHLSHTRGILSR